MAKIGPPKMKNPANPAAPKRILTAQEAEDLLVHEAAPNEEEESTEDKTENEDQFEDNAEVPGDDPGIDEEFEEEPGDEEVIEDDPRIKSGDRKPAVFKPKPPRDNTRGSGDNLAGPQQEFLNKVKRLGEQHGKGAASLITLAEWVIGVGADGTFPEKNVSDIYITFRSSSNTAAGKNADGTSEVHKTDPTIVSNTSKLKSFFKLGEKFPDTAVKLINTARDIHVNILRNKDERKMLRSSLIATYEALVKVARTQLEQETDAKGHKTYKYPNILTQDQIRDIFIDPDKQAHELTVEEVIKLAVKSVERVIKGKVDPGNRDVYKRDPFPDTNAPPNEDDGSIGRALKISLDFLFLAGERVKKGFEHNYRKEQEEIARRAEERHKRKLENDAKREAERQARAADKARKAAERQAEKEAAE